MKRSMQIGTAEVGRGAGGEFSDWINSHIEPMNPRCGASFLPLLAKRGEGRGEEPQGTGRNSFDVPGFMERW